LSEKLKIYGTRVPKGRGTKRITIRHHYYEIGRDKKGKFEIVRKWSPKTPIKAVRYTERQPLEITYTTGKEAKEKIVEELKEWRWIDYEIGY